MYYSLFCFPEGVKIINKETLELYMISYEEAYIMHLSGEYIDNLESGAGAFFQTLDIRDKSLLSDIKGFCYSGLSKAPKGSIMVDGKLPIIQDKFQTDFDVCLPDLIIHTNNRASIIWYEGYFFHTSLKSCIGIHRGANGIMADRLHIYPDDTIDIKETPLLELAQHKVSCSCSEFMRSILFK